MATKAKTRQDVDNMSTDDQLWDSLSNKYGQRADEITEQYNQAFSQLNNQMLSRGMQRSSYGTQILGNMLDKRNKAYAANTSDLIAAYEDRLSQERDKEWQRDYQERSLSQNQSQFEAGQALSREQMAQNQSQFEASQAQNQSQFEANLGLSREQLAQNQSQFEANLGLSREQLAQNQSQFEASQAQNQSQFEANIGLSREQLAEQKAQNAWNQKFQQEQADLAQRNTEWSQKNTEQQQLYQQSRDAVSDSQWEKTFGLQEKQLGYDMSSGDRSYYASWVQAAAANGKDVSDDMLAKAGISRDDYNAMKAEAAVVAQSTGGGGGRYTPKTTTDTDKDKNKGTVTDESFNTALGGTGDKVTINAAPASDLVNRWAKQTSAKTAKEVAQKALVPKKTFK